MANTPTKAREDFNDPYLKRINWRFDQIETVMQDGFKSLEHKIYRLGARYGIYFDIIISDGDHILVEIAASVKRDIKKRLERKRDLYVKETGVTPARFILAVASIHSRRAQALREAGFDVIEPDDEND